MAALILRSTTPAGSRERLARSDGQCVVRVRAPDVQHLR